MTKTGIRFLEFSSYEIWISMTILGENGLFPLIFKLCSNLSQFSNYLGICPYFGTRFFENWVPKKSSSPYNSSFLIIDQIITDRYFEFSYYCWSVLIEKLLVPIGTNWNLIITDINRNLIWNLFTACYLNKFWNKLCLAYEPL